MTTPQHADDAITADVIILGGGLVGLTLAAAVDNGGMTSIVVDPADPAAQARATYDGRATAVASASWKMLEAIGVAARLQAPDAGAGGCPIETIRVTDGLAPGGLTFEAEPGDALGRMFENRHLRAALRVQVEAAENVTLMTPAVPARVERGEDGVRVTLADGRKLRAGLLVAADGRGSSTRAAAGIRVARWSYDHQAIVATIGHDVPHGNVAYEIFYPSGPFAILPMLPTADGAHRSAIVWSVAAADGPAYLDLPDRAFTAALEERMGGFLGPLRPAGPRANYPLGFHHAATITGTRLALVGDAAHGIHPIAGQGLNLGFRDVAALAQVVLTEGVRVGLDAGDAQLLARYSRWRALDVLSIAASTDALTRLFGVRGRVASAVRNLGMSAIDRVTPVKARLMEEARGSSGELPLLLRGLPV